MEVECHSVGVQVAVHVRDTGLGIPPADPAPIALIGFIALTPPAIA